MMRYVILFAIVPLSAACTRNAFYQSPFHTNSHPYRTMPLQSDSSKSTWYASGGFSVGSANESGKDQIVMFYSSVYRAHNLRNFKAYYGLTGTLGTYEVTPYANDLTAYNFNPEYINENVGKKSARGAGLIAGGSFVFPFNTGGELRLGLDGTVQRESGRYLQFRQLVPDSSANVVNKYQTDGTFGMNLDLIGRSRGDGSRFGWKLSRIVTLNRQLYHPANFDERIFKSFYLSSTFHYTNQQITGFLQINLGSYSSNFQTGVNYRFGK